VVISFYIQEGELEFQLGDQTVIATPGTFLYSPKGHLHSFKNNTTQLAKMLVWYMPAGIEQFFADFQSELLRSAVEGDTIWAEWYWFGTHRDGIPFGIRGVSIVGVQADQIEWARFYMEPVDK
jgi:uncharacterized cupin superfamily protein